MRIISVCRHLDIYCGENQVPDITFGDMQDICEPEVFDMLDEKTAIKRTLSKYVSSETALELMKFPNEQIGAYSLIKDENRYTLVMFFQLNINETTTINDFALHLADLFIAG